MTVILGLEISCDDSAVALVTSDRRILAQAVVGQNSAHQPYGGVVPEIAARAHVEILPGLIASVLRRRQDCRSPTSMRSPRPPGPGLIGGVMVALLAGKGLALAAGKPLIAVNHLEGHALSPRLVDPDLDFPYLAAARLGRPLPAARGARGRRLPAPRDDHRRCRRRGVRQGREAARPRLSGRTGDRRAGEGRRSARGSAAAPAGRFGRAAFLLRRAEERGPARSRLRRLSSARTSPRASSRRSSIASSTAPGSRLREAMRRRWSSPAASRPTRRSASRLPISRRAQGRRFSVPPALAVHRQCGDDRLGRRRALRRAACATRSTRRRARAGRSTNAPKRCAARA